MKNLKNFKNAPKMRNFIHGDTQSQQNVGCIFTVFALNHRKSLFCQALLP